MKTASSNRLWHIMTLGVLLAAGCAAGTDGRWVGPVTPGGPGCAPSRGVLVAQAGGFVFAPSEGVVVLRGTISKSGELHGLYQTEGQNHQPVIYHFDGSLTGGGIQGVLRAPGCTAHVALRPG